MPIFCSRYNAFLQNTVCMWAFFFFTIKNTAFLFTTPVPLVSSVGLKWIGLNKEFFLLKGVDQPNGNKVGLPISVYRRSLGGFSDRI